MSENWIINVDGINGLASFVLTSACFRLNNDNANYSANILLFKPHAPNEQKANDLQCVLNILINTSKEARLHNILKISGRDDIITIEIDPKYKDEFKSVYPNLLNAIKQYNPSFKDLETSLKKLREFDITEFDISPRIINNENVANEVIEKTNVEKFAQELSNKKPVGHNK